MLIQKLIDQKLISPPDWLKTNLVYSTRMGSQAYGTTTDSSDEDVYGIAIPPKNYIFPHLGGFVLGFGSSPPRFDQYQQHHVKIPNIEKEYDIVVYSIIRIFELARQGNPNIIDMLFVDDNCIMSTTVVGNMIRENRHMFLSKKIYASYKGYAYSQLKHLNNKNPIGKRKERVNMYKYDTKFAMHLVRLLDFAFQILIKGDLDLQENNEQLKAIRRGEWTEQEVRDYFSTKEKELERIYLKSGLQEVPDESELKTLLLDCLEAHYGNLDGVIVRPDETLNALRKIDNVLERLKKNKVL